MGYFVKFKYYRTTDDQEPHKIQKYEVENRRFAELSRLLPSNEGPYMIRYVDSDGDLCTIDSDSTLKVALKGLMSGSTLILRVDDMPTCSQYAIKKENETKSNNKPARRSARLESVKQDVKKEVKSEEDIDSDFSLGSDDEGSEVLSDDDLIVIDDEDEEAEDWWKIV